MNQRSALRELVGMLLHKRGDDQPFVDSDSLLMSGRLQSVDALEIILFLEQKYGFDFSDRPFDQAQIDSVESLVALLG